MKKLLLAAIAVLVFVNVNAQETKFGLTAGYLGVNAKVKSGGNSATASDSGFYIGGVADIATSNELHIQPELLYANVNDSSALILPIMLKYYVSENFNLQAGPQVLFSLEKSVQDVSSVEIGLGAGLGYDINDNFFLEARYSFQLNNSYTGNLDITARENILTIGVGYRFN
tara:strand:- start:66 stop:578 length:513 start_codon:yes stop_codon:yes gene_type:complete